MPFGFCGRRCFYTEMQSHLNLHNSFHILHDGPWHVKILRWSSVAAHFQARKDVGITRKCEHEF